MANVGGGDDEPVTQDDRKLAEFELRQSEIGNLRAQHDPKWKAWFIESEAQLIANRRRRWEQMRQKWLDEFGFEYPERLEDCQRLAVRIGMDPGGVASNEWRHGVLRRLIEGHILRDRDLAAANAIDDSGRIVEIDANPDIGMNRGSLAPEFPEIIDDHANPAIVYKNICHPVSPNAVQLFKAMLDKYPERVGLTKVIGAHPERTIRKLPKDLQAIIDTNHDGSRLTI